MNEKDLDLQMSEYVTNQDISGASLLIRRGEEVLYENCWGYGDLANKTPIAADSIFRMMSMTKCITAVAVMICVERGLLELDQPVSNYLPEFGGMRVTKDDRYEFDPKKMKKLPLLLLTFRMDKVKSCKADRDITIRDLLSHSSGLQQGMVGLLDMIKEKRQFDSLEDWALHYSENLLDFQPGTCTGYSPLAGFDLLGYLVSLVSGRSLEQFVQEEICAPLQMKDTTFFLSEEQKSRLVRVYKRKKDRLMDVTGSKDDMAGFFHAKEVTFEHGCGGIYSTLHDYDRFGHMLLNGGSLDGVQILKSETVKEMGMEAPENHLEPDPGFVWGLGMKIRQDPTKSDCKATAGTYGWSGAFGTHFFISPEDDLEVVFMTNRSDLNGSGSYVSAKLEEMVFAIWGK